MNFSKILPLSKGRLDVLLEIYSNKEDYLRNISKSLRMNPSLAYSILRKLYDSKFIVKRKHGKEVIYSISNNRDYNLLISLLEEYHLEKVVERAKVLQTIINFLINNKELINSSYKIHREGNAGVIGTTGAAATNEAGCRVERCRLTTWNIMGLSSISHAS